jgi:sugar/nucleoside kinase (ribokinase family)
VSIDRVASGPPQIGGGPYHAGRALRLLSTPGSILARCAAADRRFVLPRLATLGIPLRLLEGATTSAFSFSYDGDVRKMSVDAIGDAWRPEDATAVDRRARWVHIAPLLRSDFPAETIAAFARGRRVLFDGQGLTRRPELGPLQLDAEFDPAVLEHISILKLAEEEAAVLGGVEGLDVPEIVVTLGSRGSIVYTGGAEIHVPANPLPEDPTGAGDAFATAYLAGRAAGHAPAAAARRATAVVGAILR